MLYRILHPNVKLVNVLQKLNVKQLLHVKLKQKLHVHVLQKKQKLLNVNVNVQHWVMNLLLVLVLYQFQYVSPRVKNMNVGFMIQMLLHVYLIM